jgi:hypothetical protein
MLETCRGPYFLINWIKSASRWFHYTDIPWCTVSKILSLYIYVYIWISVYVYIRHTHTYIYIYISFYCYSYWPSSLTIVYALSNAGTEFSLVVSIWKEKWTDVLWTDCKRLPEWCAYWSWMTRLLEYRKETFWIPDGVLDLRLYKGGDYE